MLFEDFITLYIIIAVLYSLNYSLNNWRKYIRGKNKRFMIEMIDNYYPIKIITISLTIIMTSLFFPLVLTSQIIEYITNYFRKNKIKREEF